jgi:hypothetical protein
MLRPNALIEHLGEADSVANRPLPHSMQLRFAIRAAKSNTELKVCYSENE